MSSLLRAYLAFSHVSGPIWRAVHRRRLRRGKEIPERLAEKYGEYGTSRPAGTLLWFHALSVGESLALVPLIERALAELPKAHVVLTTSTATSVEALSKAALPDRCIHVLLPIDTTQATRRFLDHWRPDLAAITELDFWPRLMVETHRRDIPMALINSRLQKQNQANRQRLGGAIGDILALFDQMLVQDVASAQRFAELGADETKIKVTGALKSAARPLPADGVQLAALQPAVRQRPVWLAAATSSGEHPLVVDAHRSVCMGQPETLLIIAPRNPRDGDEAEANARRHFDRVGRRSRGDVPDEKTQVYIADTIGEMGLWYRIAPVSFIGHSLDLNGHGLEGKNPFEAAALSSAILHGPSVSYFSESYSTLAEAGAAREVESVESLAEAVVQTLSGDVREAMLDGAARVIAAKSTVLEDTWGVLRSMLRD